MSGTMKTTWRPTYSTSHMPDLAMPEPVHRIPPEGFSSGMSLRDYPATSYDNVIKICQFYENKCSGNRSIANAARYIYQMSSEVQCELQKLKDMYYRDSTITKEWLDNFGLNSEFFMEYDSLKIPLRVSTLTPKNVASVVLDYARKALESEQEILGLRQDIKKLISEFNASQAGIQTAYLTSHEHSRQQYRKDLKTTEELWKKKYDALMKEKSEEIQQIKRQKDADMAQQKAHYSGLLARKESDDSRSREARDRTARAAEQKRDNGRKFEDKSNGRRSDDSISELSVVSIVSDASEMTSEHPDVASETESENSVKNLVELLRQQVDEKDKMIELLRTSLMFKPGVSYRPPYEVQRKAEPSAARSKHGTLKTNASDTVEVPHYKKPQPWDLAVSRDTSAYLTRPFFHGQHEEAFGPGALFQKIQHS